MFHSYSRHVFKFSRKKSVRKKGRRSIDRERGIRVACHRGSTIEIGTRVRGNHRCCWLRVSCAIKTRGKRRAWLRSARLRKLRVRGIQQSALATVAPVMAAENTRARCYRRRRRRRRSVPPRLYLASATATATDPATRG